MEPFRVTCETCGAKLKVRSEEVIGQIHACPKCDSMVQIVPPSGWSAIAVGTSQELKAPVISDVPMASSLDFEVPDLFSPQSTEAASAGASTDVTIVEAAAPVEFVPIAAVSSSSSMIWVTGAAAVLVIGGVVAVMWPRGEAIKVAVAPPAPLAASAVVEEQPEELATEVPPSEQVANDEQPSPIEQPSENSEVLGELPAKLPELPSEEGATTEKADAPAAGDVAVTAPPTTDREPAVAESAEKPKDSPVMKFDPLDFDPSELTLAPSAPARSASVPAEADVATDVNEDPTSEAKAQENQSAQPAVDRTLTARLGPMTGDPVARDVAQQLALRVNSFQVDAAPLAEFVASLSKLANVAITTEPSALELTGLSANQPVSVQAADTSIEKLLKDTLAKYRLEIVETTGQLKLSPVNGDRRRAVDYDVADLVGDDGGKQLTGLIQQLVAPESWTADGGSIEINGTKLHVDHTQNVRHQVLIFCERLRLARGQSLRSRYPTALLSVEPAYEQLAQKLNEKTTFTFLPWSQLSNVLAHWQDASGLTILVDWSALADIELAPASPMAASAIDRTWGDVLDGVLEPLDLAWWPAGNDTIQITSRDAIGDIRRIEFYAVSESMRGQFASENALVESIQAAMHRADGGSEQFPSRIHLDGPSKRLIVLASPEVHRAIGRHLAADGRRLSAR